MKRHVHLALTFEKKRKPESLIASLRRGGFTISCWWKMGLVLFLKTTTTLSLAELEASAMKCNGVKAAYANT